MTAPYPTGPVLTYTSTLNDDGTQESIHIDRVPVADPRERALCRALLLHAIALLDASEPTRRGAEVQR